MAEQAIKKAILVQAKTYIEMGRRKDTNVRRSHSQSTHFLWSLYRTIFRRWCNVFALQPENAVVADSNPELINMYRQVADHVDDVINYLKEYENTSEMFYAVRSLEWTSLPKAEAAARTIFSE